MAKDKNEDLTPEEQAEKDRQERVIKTDTPNGVKEYDPANPLAWRVESGAKGGTFAADRARTQATGEPTDAEVAEANFIERMPALQHPAQLPRDRADAAYTRTQRDRDDLAGETSKAKKAAVDEQRIEAIEDAEEQKDRDRKTVAAVTDTEPAVHGTTEIVADNKAEAKKADKARKDDAK